MQGVWPCLCSLCFGHPFTEFAWEMAMASNQCAQGVQPDFVVFTVVHSLKNVTCISHKQETTLVGD